MIVYSPEDHNIFLDTLRHGLIQHFWMLNSIQGVGQAMKVCTSLVKLILKFDECEIWNIHPYNVHPVIAKMHIVSVCYASAWSYSSITRNYIGSHIWYNYSKVHINIVTQAFIAS